MKPMQKMIAIDRMRYGTRRLLAGEEFECKPAEAKVWVALKKAKEAPLRPPAQLSKPPAALVRKVPKKNEEPAVAEQPSEAATEVAEATVATTEPQTITPMADDLLAEARADYKLKLGKRPHHSWDVEELRRRISEAE